ncbi:2-hydroxychromene-2-carboxylate isomerase [Marinibaculum pumilum]|uniref:2-hydroxychromene-2-carboxylate isomerase n=1 Tax=Marinibaculum pumilum TaxID=1766165 RepID=A0ABV7L5T1_9PROT
MSAAPAVTFWFEFASTYSYPAAHRVGALAAAAGVPVVWRPFLLGPVFAAQGMTDSPFNIYPVKGAYMWRDLERICDAQGLPLTRPGAFPRNGLRAARIATAALAAGAAWAPDFVRAVYHANFAEDREIADPAVLARLLTGLGADAADWQARAETPETKAALRAATDEAQALGLFGAPSFTIAGADGGVELFWGNDRLEQALAWAR